MDFLPICLGNVQNHAIVEVITERTETFFSLRFFINWEALPMKRLCNSDETDLLGKGKKLMLHDQTIDH